MFDGWCIVDAEVIKRGPFLSTTMKIAEALQVSVGLLFVLASDQKEQGDIDEQVAGQLVSSARASLGTPDNISA